MSLRTVALAVSAGLAAALLVGVGVTELLLPVVAFSLFVGLPAGLLAGLAASAFVYLGASGGRVARRRSAVALGWFGVTLLGVFLLASLAFGVRNSVALVVAAVLGALVALGTYVRERPAARAAA
ncbi:MAG: hypothetical protein ABEJ28_08885 [Salinigranum sp.]